MKFCATILFATSILMLWGSSPAAGFVPVRYLAWALNAISFSFDGTTTHKDMTKEAVLDVATNLLIDNPNPNSPGSSRRISTLTNPNEAKLVTAYYGERRRGITKNFQDAIETMQDANANVDLGAEGKLAEAHFDGETFQAGQNRIVEKRQIITSHILRENFAVARRETGGMLHTLQDFYSHSNWIENGNRVPYAVLGQRDQRPSNIANPNQQTCNDCTEDGTVIVGQIIAFFSSKHDSARRFYDCPDNIERSLHTSEKLTSGYHSGQRASNGRVIQKPSGKCSHGGFLDSTSDDFAKGGINKDSPFKKWSPHYYYYNEAVVVARQATSDILQQIRMDVNNDTLFAAFLGLTISEAASIAYVIDTTGSMGEELPEIQATIPQIRASLQEYVNSFSGNIRVQFILVPFNDPDPGYIYKTDNIEQFLRMIAELSAAGGGDTPEPSIGALIRAIKASEQGSPIFVFTDAPASDSYLVNEAIALISRKEVTVSFALVDALTKRSVDTQQDFVHKTSFRSKRQTLDSAYEQLAIFSGGQILNINTNDISRLASLVSFTARQSRNTIFRQSDILYGSVTYTFPVDTYTNEVVISANGQSIVISAISPEGIDVTSLAQYTSSLNTATSYISNINITDDFLRGEWTIRIQSQGSYSISVLGNTELSFSSELFKIDPSNTYGFSQLEGKPSQGTPIIALFGIESENGVTSVTISMVNIINSEGVKLLSLNNLTKVDSGSYVCVFLPPSETFQMQLVGSDGNGYNYSHIIDTAVEVADISLVLGENETGFLTMRPGDYNNVSLTLKNGGPSATFRLTVNTVITGNGTDFFEYFLAPETVFVESNSSTDITMSVSVFTGATDGISVTFSVIAQSVFDDNVNNFISIYLVTTTVPPPEFTENLFSGALPYSSIEAMKLLMLMGLVLIWGIL